MGTEFTLSEIRDQKQRLHLRLLNELSTNLQSLLESDDFYQDIVNLIKSKLNYYSIQVWTVTSGEAVALRAQSGAYGNFIRVGHQITSPGVGITGEVIRTKRSYISNDVSSDPNFTNLSFPVKSKSQLCSPIVKDDQVIATLNIESDELGAFNEDDRVAIETIASQIAVAIANRRLLNKTKDFNQKLRDAVNEKTLELREAHRRILDQQHLLQRENTNLKSLVKKDSETANKMIGSGSTMIGLVAMVDKIAPTSATVLIQGESGTGKELIARRLHFKSERLDQPYITVNCGALQETLLESELFGHEKGAFTGALNQKVGLVETADNGTLFLDEIGEMSLPIQAKLLRFLQEGEFYRIGGKRPLKVNVRVISATNRDLEEEVKNGRFREDLFYRLNTITLRMPPLRKRTEDIPELVEYFLENSRFGGAIRKSLRIDPAVIDVFKSYMWPGNIRELQNTVERMKILSDGPKLTLDDIPSNIKAPAAQPAESQEFRPNAPLDEIEKQHILKTLAFHHGNKTKTAMSLGVTIKTLYNKLHRYGVLSPEPPTSQIS